MAKRKQKKASKAQQGELSTQFEALVKTLENEGREKLALRIDAVHTAYVREVAREQKRADREAQKAERAAAREAKRATRLEKLRARAAKLQEEINKLED